MSNIWFKKIGFIYQPIHVMGFAVTFLCVVLDVFFFKGIDRNSHSVSDTLINFFVYFTCVAFWWKWIADKTS